MPVPETYDDLSKFINNKETDVLFAKASAAAALAVQDIAGYGGGIGAPIYEKEWIELYTKYVWAYAGIYAISGVMSCLVPELKKRDRKTGELTDIPTHPAIDLLLKPNKDMTGAELAESRSVFMETVGVAYWEVVHGNEVKAVAGKTVSSEKLPVELWPIRPDYLSPEPNDNGKGIKQWIFQTKKHARKKNFRKDQIVPFRYFNPLSEWYGLGSLQPAIGELKLENAMANWNLDFFENGITPEGLITTDQTLQPWQMEKLGKQIKEFVAGKGRKVLILSQGLGWEQMSVDPKEIEFIKGREVNREGILAALGVPPIMVGLLEHAKYDNYALQLLNFHKHTILPKVVRMENCLQTQYLPLWSDLEPTDEFDYVILYNKDGLMLEDADKVTERTVIWFENGWIKRSEAAKRVGQKLEDDEPDGYFMRNDLIPVDVLFAQGTDSIEQAEDLLQRRVKSAESEIGSIKRNRKKAATDD